MEPNNGVGQPCPICMEEITQDDVDNGRVRYCVNGHAMHIECSEPLVSGDNPTNTCPLCRAEIIPGQAQEGVDYDPDNYAPGGGDFDGEGGGYDSGYEADDAGSGSESDDEGSGEEGGGASTNHGNGSVFVGDAAYITGAELNIQQDEGGATTVYVIGGTEYQTPVAGNTYSIYAGDQLLSAAATFVAGDPGFYTFTY